MGTETRPIVEERWLAAILALGIAGGLLVWWPFHDDRSISWIRCHLDIVQSQLHGLAGQLQEYRKAHGQYPSNDEGLGVLTNFESRLTLAYYLDKSEIPRGGALCRGVLYSL